MFGKAALDFAAHHTEPSSKSTTAHLLAKSVSEFSIALRTVF